LIWLVTAAGGVVLADWKKLSNATAPDSGQLFVAYLIGAICGVVFGLLVIIVALAVDIALRNRNRQANQQLPFGLIVDYLHYGYAFYAKRRDDLLVEANSETVQYLARERMERLNRNVSVQNTIAGLVHAVAAVFAETDETRRNERRVEVIDLILAGLPTAVASQAQRDGRELKIEANYMTYLEWSAATPEQRKAVLFRFGEEERYSGLLIHNRGKVGSPQETVILPVDGKIADRNTLLPGAPEAFVLRKAAIINCHEVAFRAGVPKKTKEEIQKFFADVDYKSVASIPIVAKGGPIGVINIESNQLDMLGEGADIGKVACSTLQPFAAILSQML
jgi:hypothetical protein